MKSPRRRQKTGRWQRGKGVLRAAALGLLLLWGTEAPAQLGPGVNVFDAANFGQNTITATQSIITAIHQVMSVANQVLELTPVEEIIIAGGIAEDLAILGEVIISAELVWYDLQSLDAQMSALFGLETAPDTRAGLDERLLEIKQFYYRSLSFAMRTQALLMTVFRTIEHITRLVDAIGALIGNMQGNQVLVQTNTTISKTLVIMETQQAAWQRADTVQRLSEGVILASLEKIALKRLEDHPRY